MHLIVRESTTLDEFGEPQDLALDPADFILLSFSDSDLATFRAGFKSPLNPTLSLPGSGDARNSRSSFVPGKASVSTPSPLPHPLADVATLSGKPAKASLRERAGVKGPFSAHFINLTSLRHPISVDLFLEKTIPGTKAILLRLLGGLDYWRYGAEELARACRKYGIALAVLPGDGRADPRLPLLSTIEADELDALDRLIGNGGSRNAAIAMSALVGRRESVPVALSSLSLEELPYFGIYREIERDAIGSIAIVFYRSFLLAGDIQPIDALVDALAQRPSPPPSHGRGRRPNSPQHLFSPSRFLGNAIALAANTSRPVCREKDRIRGANSGATVTAYYLPSLKAPEAAAWLREHLKLNPPDVIINTTAFSARGEDGRSPLDDAGCPVIQAAMASSSEDAWCASLRGLSSTDLAMHVVLPEIDGRLFAGAISFKDRDASGSVFHGSHAEGVSHVAGLANAWVRLRRKLQGERKLALVLSTYPGRPDQIAHAVGLDGPESALRLARHLQSAGYSIDGLPASAQELLRPFVSFSAKCPLTQPSPPRGEG
jgi:cobaltochelatase CobN